jgi:hypothetical protein
MCTVLVPAQIQACTECDEGHLQNVISNNISCDYFFTELLPVLYLYL